MTIAQRQKLIYDRIEYYLFFFKERACDLDNMLTKLLFIYFSCFTLQLVKIFHY